MSALITGTISGRIALITTSLPFSFSRAVWTCAIEADASGSIEKSSNQGLYEKTAHRLFDLLFCQPAIKGATRSCSSAS